MRRCRVVQLAALACLIVIGTGAGLATEDKDAGARAQLIEELRAERRSLVAELGPGGFDERVLSALGRVPRHAFVPDVLRTHAYENRPLPIGSGQTISQPYIVALMTELLGLKPQHRVLEIGTGSGYQTAVLAELVARVYTVEIDPRLARSAAAVLTQLGYANVMTRIGDGYLGWAEQAPFDAIIVTAAPTSVPPPLIEQLKSGASLVIPVGETWGRQSLLVVTKHAPGRVTTREVLPVAFVPLTGRH